MILVRPCLEGPLTCSLQVIEYNRANREVAILCNHQRTVPKSFEAAYQKLEDREKMLLSQIDELRGMVEDLEGKGKGKSIRLLPPDAPVEEEEEAVKPVPSASASAGDVKVEPTGAPAPVKPKKPAKSLELSHLFPKIPDVDAVKKRIKVCCRRCVCWAL